MLEFLGFGRTKSDGIEVGDTLPTTRTLPGEYPTATQREVLRLTLHTLLKRHGIPAGWLGAEMGAFPSAEEPEGILLQLVVLHWHPGFGLYAPALQQELLEGLKRFDPSTTARKYSVHWKFSADCGCPHQALPEPSFWTASDPRLSPAATAPTKPELRMQPMPVIRPTAASPLPPNNDDDDDDDQDNGFAATQLHDIR